MDHGNARIRPQRRECKSPNRVIRRRPVAMPVAMAVAVRQMQDGVCVGAQARNIPNDTPPRRTERPTCIPNDPGIDYAAAPDLLRACIDIATCPKWHSAGGAHQQTTATIS